MVHVVAAVDIKLILQNLTARKFVLRPRRLLAVTLHSFFCLGYFRFICFPGKARHDPLRWELTYLDPGWLAESPLGTSKLQGQIVQSRFERLVPSPGAGACLDGLITHEIVEIYLNFQLTGGYRTV